MLRDRLRRATATRPRTYAWSAVALLATGVYFAYLAVQDARAERFIAGLEEREPARYLDELRRLEGFETYLAAYRDMRGRDGFEKAPPTFLSGRWTMRDEAIRVPPNNSFALCPDPLLIEYGHVTLAREESRTLAARYRLTDGGELEIETDGTDVLPVRIVAYGPQINYLEFTPPGADDSVHAYRCTM